MTANQTDWVRGPRENRYVAVLLSDPKTWVSLEGVRNSQAAELRGSALLGGRVYAVPLFEGERPEERVVAIAKHLRRMAQIHEELAAEKAAESDSPEASAPVNTSRRIKGMQLNENGHVRLNKAELQALLMFANKEATSPFCGVHFKSTKPTKRDGDTAKRLKARASTGQVAVDAFGHNLSGGEHEWFVRRDFLASLVKLADAEHSILLKFSGASLHEGAIVDESGAELEVLQTAKDAANSQTSFADEKDWNRLLKIPSKSQALKFLDFKLSALPFVKKVGAAIPGDCVRFYPPPEDHERLLVVAEGEDTDWVALVDPAETAPDED